MKIKTISRSTTAVTREKRADLVKVHRNLDPKLHPFEKAREYTRAVVAAKMDRMFAKPFVGALDGHSDSVYCCATSPKSLVQSTRQSCVSAPLCLQCVLTQFAWLVLLLPGGVPVWRMRR